MSPHACQKLIGLMAKMSTRVTRQSHAVRKPTPMNRPAPGFLVSQDTYYVGYLKGVGRIYQQTAIDTYSIVGFAKLYTAKVPVTAAALLNDRVLRVSGMDAQLARAGSP